MAKEKDNKNSSKIKPNRKIVDIGLEIQDQDAIIAGKMNFVSLNFIQTILPHSKLDEKIYERVNGNYSLKIVALENFIPYGTVPRLILSWLITTAIKTNSKEIHIGRNLSEFMKMIGFSTDGKTMERFKKQLQALFGSAINVSYDDGKTIEAKNILIATNYAFWWIGNNDEFSSSITLSEEFFDLIKKYHVPVDLRAITALKRSSLAVDIYSWLTYRFSSLKKRTFISWEALQFQFGSGYQDNYTGRQSFKRNFHLALEKIRILYPEARLSTDKDGLVLFPSPTHIPLKKEVKKLGKN